MMMIHTHIEKQNRIKNFDDRTSNFTLLVFSVYGTRTHPVMVYLRKTVFSAKIQRR